MATNDNKLVSGFTDLNEKFNVSSQAIDDLASNIANAISSSTAAAVANTQNVEGTQYLTNYYAASDLGIIGSSQYQKPTNLDSFNKLFSSGLDTAVNSAMQVQDLKIEQLDMQAQFLLEGADMYQQQQQWQAQQELARQKYELSVDKFQYQQDRDLVLDDRWKTQFDEEQRQFDEKMSQQEYFFETDLAENQRQFDLTYEQTERENQMRYDVKMQKLLDEQAAEAEKQAYSQSQTSGFMGAVDEILSDGTTTEDDSGLGLFKGAGSGEPLEKQPESYSVAYDGQAIRIDYDDGSYDFVPGGSDEYDDAFIAYYEQEEEKKGFGGGISKTTYWDDKYYDSLMNKESNV